MSAIQSKTLAKIQLSKSSESLPHTQERVILIIGTIKQVVAALDIIVTKLVQERHLLEQLNFSKQDSTGFVTPPTPVAALGRTESEKSTTPSVCSDSATTITTNTTTTGPAASEAGKIFKLKLLIPRALSRTLCGKGGENIRRVQKAYSVNVHTHHSTLLPAHVQHMLAVIVGDPADVIKAAACLTLHQTSHSDYDLYGEIPVSSPPLGALPENNYHTYNYDNDYDSSSQQSYYQQEQMREYYYYYYYYYQQQQAAAVAAAGGYQTGEYFAPAGYLVDDATSWAIKMQQEQQQLQQQQYYYGTHMQYHTSPYTSVPATMYSSPAMVPSCSPPMMPTSPDVPIYQQRTTYQSPSSKSHAKHQEPQLHRGVEAEVLMTMTESQAIAVLGEKRCRLEDLERVANVQIVVMGFSKSDKEKKKLRQLQIRGGLANVQYAQQLIGQRLLESVAEVQEIERKMKMMHQQRYKKKRSTSSGSCSIGSGAEEEE